MDFKTLQYFASDCQEQADEMAFKLINQNELFSSISIFQSKCDFNLFWAYQISPEMFLHIETIKLLSDNINNFKRKISLLELVKYDLLIIRNEIETFNDFKKLL